MSLLEPGFSSHSFSKKEQPKKQNRRKPAPRSQHTYHCLSLSMRRFRAALDLACEVGSFGLYDYMVLVFWVL